MKELKFNFVETSLRDFPLSLDLFSDKKNFQNYENELIVIHLESCVTTVVIVVSQSVQHITQL